MAHKVGLSGWVTLGGAPCVQIKPSEVTLHVGPLEVPFDALISLAKGGTASVGPLPFAFPRVSFCELLSYVEAVLDALQDEGSDGVKEVRKTFDLLKETIEKSDLLSSLAEHVALSGTLLFGIKAGKPSIAMGEYTLYVGPLMLSAEGRNGLGKGADEPSAALEAAPAAVMEKTRGARGSGGARAPESVPSSQPVPQASPSLSTSSLTLTVPRTNFAELLDFVGSAFSGTKLADNLNELAAMFGPGGDAPPLIKSALSMLGVSGEFFMQKFENKKLSLVPRELCVYFGPLKLDLANLKSSNDDVTIDLPPTSFAELIGFIASVGGRGADDEAGQDSHHTPVDNDDASAVLGRVRDKLFDPESPLAAFGSAIASVKVSGEINLNGRKMRLLNCTMHLGALSLKLDDLRGEGTLSVVLALSSPNELLALVGPPADATTSDNALGELRTSVTEKWNIAQEDELMKSFLNDLRVSGTVCLRLGRASKGHETRSNPAQGGTLADNEPETSSIAVKWGPCTIAAEKGSADFVLDATLGEVLHFAAKVDGTGTLAHQIAELHAQLTKGDASLFAAMLMRVTVTGTLRLAKGAAPELVGVSLTATGMTEESKRHLASLQSLNNIRMLDADDEKRLQAYNAIEAVIVSLRNVHEQGPKFSGAINMMQPKLDIVSTTLGMPKTACSALNMVEVIIRIVKLACSALGVAPAPVGSIVAIFKKALVMLEKSVKAMKRVLGKLQKSTSRASKKVNNAQYQLEMMTERVDSFHEETRSILDTIDELKSLGIYLPIDLTAPQALTTVKDECDKLKEQINNVKESANKTRDTIADVLDRFKVVNPISKLVACVKLVLDPLGGPLNWVKDAWEKAKNSKGPIGFFIRVLETVGNAIESALKFVLEKTGLQHLLKKAEDALNPLNVALKPLEDGLSSVTEALRKMTNQFLTLARFPVPNLDALKKQLTTAVMEPLVALRSFTDALGDDAVGKLKQLLEKVLALKPQAIAMVIDMSQLPEEKFKPLDGCAPPLAQWRSSLKNLLQDGVLPNAAMGNAAEMLAGEGGPLDADPTIADDLTAADESSRVEAWRAVAVGIKSGNGLDEAWDKLVDGFVDVSEAAHGFYELCEVLNGTEQLGLYWHYFTTGEDVGGLVAHTGGGSPLLRLLMQLEEPESQVETEASVGEEKLKQAFCAIGKDCEDPVSTAELRHIMNNLFEELTVEEVDELIREAGNDDDTYEYSYKDVDGLRRRGINAAAAKGAHVWRVLVSLLLLLERELLPSAKPQM